MLILAIDTSTRAGSIAALRGGEELGTLTLASDEDYSIRLFRELHSLLQQLSIQLNQFALYAVATGPGSFTGLRVGLTAVKGWAEVHCKPIAPVSTLEAVAAQGPADAPVLAPILDAKRGQIFGGLYYRGRGHDTARLQSLGGDMVLTLAEYLDWMADLRISDPPTFVTPAPDLIRAALENSPARGRPIVEVSSVLAPSIGHLGYAKALRGELVDAMTLDANYVRRSDAELLWKG
jgi:tRNA threonylcarbamoyladenosine biosynthesis protein TsaB